MEPTQVKANAGDFFRTMGAQTFEAAYKRGKTLSQFVNDELGTVKEDGVTMDGFRQLLQVAGLRVNPLIEEGITADTGEKFLANDASRTLFVEYCFRQYRAVALGMRTAHTSQDGALGSTENPFIYSQTPRHAKQIQAAIPIAELVALTTGINGNNYQAFYLDDSAANQRLLRVNEAAELPEAKIAGTDKAIRLQKYGRKLVVSYEAARSIAVNKIGLWVQKLAAQSEAEKVKQIIDVLVNGDGNSNAATSFRMIADALDGNATANNLTLKAWLNFKKKFASPYMLTHVLSLDSLATMLELLPAGSSNVFPSLMVNQNSGVFGSLSPINQTYEGIRYGWDDQSPSGKYIGFDKNWAIERVFDVGGNIQEIGKFITNQTNVLTFSEWEGYMKFDLAATYLLDISQ